MAEHDDLYLDLSYMDEQGTGQNGETPVEDDGGQQYEAGAEQTASGDNSGGYQGDAADDGYDRMDSNDAPPADSAQHSAQPTPAQVSTPVGSVSSTKKRKAEDDEGSSTTITPRPASVVPGSLPGERPIDAITINQITHNTSEETIRQWANEVGHEQELVELKFDEFKPNGKSKGSVYVKFKTAEAAEAVKHHITSLPKPLGARSGYIVHYANFNPYYRTKDTFPNNPRTMTRQHGMGGMQGSSGFSGPQNNLRRGGGYHGGYSNNRGGMGMGMGYQNRGGMGIQVSGAGYAGGMQANQGFQQNGMGYNAQNSFRGGGMMRGGRGGVGDGDDGRWDGDDGSRGDDGRGHGEPDGRADGRQHGWWDADAGHAE
ncbi:hypothetical protein EJ06DRAFT_523841 [Trichodelitschia bisporula]|uniref:RRM domain-containing protein n=1 Tax=Trichodelitschia bisporula TaxID=703511 RepID=A0A6G1HMR5_9PEZI|nr:hypothetical protein EJ06DRAFT_523841 [Trichodelitschia bisporula]